MVLICIVVIKLLCIQSAGGFVYRYFGSLCLLWYFYCYVCFAALPITKVSTQVLWKVTGSASFSFIHSKCYHMAGTRILFSALEPLVGDPL